MRYKCSLVQDSAISCTYFRVFTTYCILLSTKMSPVHIIWSCYLLHKSPITKVSSFNAESSKMVRHTLKIFQNLLYEFCNKYDHIETLCIKLSKMITLNGILHLKAGTLDKIYWTLFICDKVILFSLLLLSKKNLQNKHFTCIFAPILRLLKQMFSEQLEIAGIK